MELHVAEDGNILRLPQQEAATKPNQREKPCSSNDHFDENRRTASTPQRPNSQHQRESGHCISNPPSLCKKLGRTTKAALRVFVLKAEMRQPRIGDHKKAPGNRYRYSSA